MGGCFVPQDYLFSDDPPPFKNNPVKIVLPVAPNTTTVTTNNGQNGVTGIACELGFSVTATDPDVDDPITVRWYVDYDANTNPTIVREQLLDNRGGATRPQVTLDMNLNQPGNPLIPAETHLLEVLVTDGVLDNDRVPKPRSMDPDAGENPSYLDRYVWVV
ncbi:MAG TPA: hypothetical protein VND93_30355, partial [Myxococcales bacterium]|nr:hypothetical protein [Myxococcales bacterium]